MTTGFMVRRQAEYDALNRAAAQLVPAFKARQWSDARAAVEPLVGTSPGDIRDMIMRAAEEADVPHHRADEIVQWLLLHAVPSWGQTMTESRRASADIVAALPRFADRPARVATMLAAERLEPPIRPEPEPPPVAAPPRGALFVSRHFVVDVNSPYVVKHLIAPGNVAALVGQPGAGKSTLAPHIAYAVAQGRSVFGLRTTAGRTLYVAAEDLRGVQRRVGALGLQYGHTDDCAVTECGNLRDPAARAAITAVVGNFKPALVVLDTIAAAFAGMDENTSQDMGAVVEFARRLAATGAAVLLVHHPAKQGDGSPRGHSVLNGTLDMVITLAPDDVTDPDTVVRGQTPKNRNGTTARDLAFRKRVVTLGTDCDGDPITTTLPVELDAAASVRPVKVSDVQRAFLSTLQECVDRESGRGVPEEVWLEAAAGLSAADKPTDRTRSLRLIHAKLVAKGLIRVAERLSRPTGEAPEFGPVPAGAGSA